MRGLAILGDWNGTPADTGRWSPSWIAAQAGLKLVHAGAGRHGNIDYGLFAGFAVITSNRVASDKLTPKDQTGSDHDLVWYMLDGWLSVGTWNVRFGRPDAQVRNQVMAALERFDLDVLVLQEAAEYHRELRNIPGYACHADERAGRQHQVILVRYGIRLSNPTTLRLSPRGWGIVTGGMHRELYASTLVVTDPKDGREHRIVDVHLPPSVNWRNGRIYGPVMRVAAYVAAARKLVRLTRRRWRRKP